MLSLVLLFVLVFFSPFSIVIALLGKMGARRRGGGRGRGALLVCLFVLRV